MNDCKSKRGELLFLCSFNTASPVLRFSLGPLNIKVLTHTTARLQSDAAVITVCLSDRSSSGPACLGINHSAAPLFLGVNLELFPSVSALIIVLPQFG